MTENVLLQGWGIPLAGLILVGLLAAPDYGGTSDRGVVFKLTR